MAKFKIKMTEVWGWACDKLQDFAIGMIPDEEQLNILITRMEDDKTEKRRLFHEALKKENRIQNPKHPQEGKLPALQAKLKRRDEQGREMGQELKDENTSKRRKAELRKLIDQCARDGT